MLRFKVVHHSTLLLMREYYEGTEYVLYHTTNFILVYHCELHKVSAASGAVTVPLVWNNSRSINVAPLLLNTWCIMARWLLSCDPTSDFNAGSG